MLDHGKKSVLGVLVDAIDYEAAVDRIVEAAKARQGFAVSALAVHGVMTGVDDDEHRYRLNHLDLVCPDGQPVRWALNGLYRCGLPDRVYGPNLMLHTCERAAAEALPIFLYGSEPAVLEPLQARLRERFANLRIAGAEPSRFRNLSPSEKAEVVERIRASGAALCFVALGCPRQEVFAYEFREPLSMPLIAVGAAFPFHAGLLPQAPRWMQDRGLEWAFRLGSEPRRLWRRYAYLNPRYAALLAAQAVGLTTPDTEGRAPDGEILYG